MKEYKVLTEKISPMASKVIQKCLNGNAYSGWKFKQIVINESTDDYIIILEKG